MPSAELHGWSLDLIARETKVCFDVRVTWRHLRGATKGHDGAPDLAGFKTGITQIEVNRGRNFARLDQLFVCGDRIGVFALVVEPVCRIKTFGNGLGPPRNLRESETGQENGEASHTL